MGFQDAVRRCFDKYVTFSGRAARPEFWWFALFLILGNIVAGAVDAAILPGDVSIVQPLFSLAVLLPSPLASGSPLIMSISTPSCAPIVSR